VGPGRWSRPQDKLRPFFRQLEQLLTDHWSTFLGVSLRAAAGPNRTVVAPPPQHATAAGANDSSSGSSSGSPIGFVEPAVAVAVACGAAGAAGLSLSQARGALEDGVAGFQDLLFYLQDLLDLGVPALAEKTATFLVHEFMRPKALAPLAAWHAHVHLPTEAAAHALVAARTAAALAASEGDAGLAAAAGAAAAAAAEDTLQLRGVDRHAAAATALFVLAQVFRAIKDRRVLTLLLEDFCAPPPPSSAARRSSPSPRRKPNRLLSPDSGARRADLEKPRYVPGSGRRALLACLSPCHLPAGHLPLLACVCLEALVNESGVDR
jgi:hypothetical protein